MGDKCENCSKQSGCAKSKIAVGCVGVAGCKEYAIAKELQYRHVVMYHDFRKELDEIWIPVFMSDEHWTVTDILTEDGAVAGMMVTAPDYIDAVYIKPEYRGKGYATKAVREFYLNNKQYKPRLHIIKNNTAAMNFWKSRFVLRELGENETDILYEIIGEKE